MGDKNVHGKKGKDKIDPAIIDYIQRCAFYMFSLQINEDMGRAWKFCVTSMDEGGRKVNKDLRKHHHTLTN